MAFPIGPVLLALSTAATLYGAKRQRDAQRRALEEARERERERIAIEAAAAARAHQARMQALSAQTNIADRQTNRFVEDLQTQLGRPERDIKQTETRRGENLDRALSRDTVGRAGSTRKVGSDVKGRISESFSERGAEAGERTAAKTNRYADRLATLGAFRELPAQAGRQANTVVRNQLPFARERESQAAIDRLRIAKASLVPRETTQYIDTSDPLGDLLYGLGQGGMFLYGSGYGGGGGPYSTSGGGGTGVSNVRTLTR